MLQILAAYGYAAGQTQTSEALYGIRMTASVYPTVMFFICTLFLFVYSLNKRLTLQIAADLAERRQKPAAI